MNVMNARIALRERSVLEVLDLTILFVSTHARAYATTALYVLAPAFAASWAVAELLGPGWAWVLAIALAFGSELPFTALASKLMFDERTRARSAIAHAVRLAPLTAFASLLALALVALGTTVLVVPGMYLAAITLFLPEAIVLEGGSLGAAFGRASRLASTSFGDAAAGAILRFAVPLGAALVADIAGRSIIEDLFEFPAPASVFKAGASALALLGFWTAVPFVATARFLLYINCRTRTEGWDVQTRFAALLRMEQI